MFQVFGCFNETKRSMVNLLTNLKVDWCLQCYIIWIELYSFIIEGMDLLWFNDPECKYRRRIAAVRWNMWLFDDLNWIMDIICSINEMEYVIIRWPKLNYGYYLFYKWFKYLDALMTLKKTLWTLHS
jgi:hypothetical protein